MVCLFMVEFFVQYKVIWSGVSIIWNQGCGGINGMLVKCGKFSNFFVKYGVFKVRSESMVEDFFLLE